ncbi:protein ORF127 [Anguillid herpesvirus 1]|uniref:Protein ORF127 n=1 Tax=Anguillid herpesvirus 1 TaxID=150286 RepID=A0A8E5AKG5_9VIRU|nr:protein ORF127 [Anguillid herpesvirus 1]ADA57890.2 protein ORF127 [Anguillid herpesvirus 1]QRM16421.1 protein ORF127 [Anguillid herpesvirus 1]QRM16680.1 protein ORF127 [Anguillid herpesvirus 1]
MCDCAWLRGVVTGGLSKGVWFPTDWNGKNNFLVLRHFYSGFHSARSLELRTIGTNMSSRYRKVFDSDSDSDSEPQTVMEESAESESEEESAESESEEETVMEERRVESTESEEEEEEETVMEERRVEVESEEEWEEEGSGRQVANVREESEIYEISSAEEDSDDETDWPPYTKDSRDKDGLRVTETSQYTGLPVGRSILLYSDPSDYLEGGRLDGRLLSQHRWVDDSSLVGKNPCTILLPTGMHAYLEKLNGHTCVTTVPSPAFPDQCDIGVCLDIKLWEIFSDMVTALPTPDAEPTSEPDSDSEVAIPDTPRKRKRAGEDEDQRPRKMGKSERLREESWVLDKENPRRARLKRHMSKLVVKFQHYILNRVVKSRPDLDPPLITPRQLLYRHFKSVLMNPERRLVLKRPLIRDHTGVVKRAPIGGGLIPGAVSEQTNGADFWWELPPSSDWDENISKIPLKRLEPLAERLLEEDEQSSSAHRSILKKPDSSAVLSGLPVWYQELVKKKKQAKRVKFAPSPSEYRDTDRHTEEEEEDRREKDRKTWVMTTGARIVCEQGVAELKRRLMALIEATKKHHAAATSATASPIKTVRLSDMTPSTTSRSASTTTFSAPSSIKMRAEDEEDEEDEDEEDEEKVAEEENDVEEEKDEADDDVIEIVDEPENAEDLEIVQFLTAAPPRERRVKKLTFFANTRSFLVSEQQPLTGEVMVVPINLRRWLASEMGKPLDEVVTHVSAPPNYAHRNINAVLEVLLWTELTLLGGVGDDQDLIFSEPELRRRADWTAQDIRHRKTVLKSMWKRIFVATSLLVGHQLRHTAQQLFEWLMGPDAKPDVVDITSDDEDDEDADTSCMVSAAIEALDDPSLVNPFGYSGEQPVGVPTQQLTAQELWWQHGPLYTRKIPTCMAAVLELVYTDEPMYPCPTLIYRHVMHVMQRPNRRRKK